MKIIIDSNVLFSALIRKSITRKIILEYAGLFLFPAFVFDEFSEHKKEILLKSGMTEKELDLLLGLILRKVVIVPNEALAPYKERAFCLVKEIDVNDVVFAACSLAYSGSVLWSDDKNLKKVKEITVLNTNEIIQILEKN